MIIEVGDYFVVSLGKEIGGMPGLFPPFLPTPIGHDGSYSQCLFRAIECVDDVVIGEVLSGGFGWVPNGIATFNSQWQLVTISKKVAERMKGPKFRKKTGVKPCPT